MTDINRVNITSEFETELYPYLAESFNSLKCPALIIGGVEDHVHILCRLARTITISKLVEKIKTGSS
ncbi:MAG: transposase [Candidatus Magnetomorum sp.]|nr:transposase [Candidatus Magnetomorum sp.]